MKKLIVGDWPEDHWTLEGNLYRAGEMAYWFTKCTAPAEDLSSVPITHIP